MSLINLFVKAAPQAQSFGRVVGIDIGSAAMKVVELEDRDGVVTLTTYGELQLGPYVEGKVIGEPVQLTPTLERQAMVDVLRESAVKAKRAVLAIPLSSSFVTTMSLNAGADDDISSRVRVEAKKYIPVPIADVTLDWAEVGVQTEESTTREVLLAAIQNDALTRFMTLMQTVELPAPPTEIECFSAIRAGYLHESPQMAIIDIGATTSKLYIVKDGLLQRMHRIPSGGAKVTERLMKEKDLSFNDAELLKRTVLPDNPDFSLVRKVMLVTYARVMKEFRQVMDEYESHTGETITKIAITGGGALVSGTDAFITEQLHVSAVPVRPFEKVAYPAFMEDVLMTVGPLFGTALGAALRHFE